MNLPQLCQANIPSYCSLLYVCFHKNVKLWITTTGYQHNFGAVQSPHALRLCENKVERKKSGFICCLMIAPAVCITDPLHSLKKTRWAVVMSLHTSTVCVQHLWITMEGGGQWWKKKKSGPSAESSDTARSQRLALLWLGEEEGRGCYDIDKHS